MDNSTLATLIVTVFGFITLFAQQHFLSSNASRERRWAKEDEKKKVEDAAAALKQDLTIAAAVAQQKADALAVSLKEALAKSDADRAIAETSRQNIAALLAENTRLTERVSENVSRVAEKADKAYDAANHVNEKILNAGLTFRNPASRGRVTDRPKPVDGVPVVEAPVTVVPPP